MAITRAVLLLLALTSLAVLGASARPVAGARQLKTFGGFNNVAGLGQHNLDATSQFGFANIDKTLQGNTAGIGQSGSGFFFPANNLADVGQSNVGVTHQVGGVNVASTTQGNHAVIQQQGRKLASSEHEHIYEVDVKVPKIKIPKVEVPKVEVPRIDVPKVEFPDIKVPQVIVDFHKVDVDTSHGHPHDKRKL